MTQTTTDANGYLPPGLALDTSPMPGLIRVLAQLLNWPRQPPSTFNWVCAFLMRSIHRPFKQSAPTHPESQTNAGALFGGLFWIGGVCLGLLISYFSVTQAQAEPKPSSASPSSSPATLLVMGDSLSAAYGIATEQGWVALLQQKLKQHGHAIDVVNASLSGETTSGGKDRLPPLLARHSPEYVIIELGANDALRGQNLRSTQNNLVAMIERSQKAGAAVLLFGIRVPSNYGPAYDQQLQHTFQQAVAKTQAAYLPFFIEPVALSPELMQSDQLHPNAAAQPKILDHVWPQIKALITQ